MIEGHYQATKDKGVEEFLANLHPSVVNHIRSSLQLTFVEMVKAHRDSLVELEVIQAEVAQDERFGTW